MSDNGFWCTADRGGTYFNLNAGGARAVTFLQRVKVVPSSKSKNLTVEITNKDAEGALFVIPIVASVAYVFENSIVASFITTKSLAVSGSKIQIEYSGIRKNPAFPLGESDGWFYYDVYQSLDSEKSAGLFLQDSTGFSGINNVLRAGYCVYRTTVTIGQGHAWSIPDNIPERNNATVFANWSSPSAVVVYNNMDKTVRVYGGDVVLNVAVFSNGFQLTMPGAGFYVFSKHSGECVYNSNYIPLFVKRTIVFNGDLIDTDEKKPMVALCSLGMGGDKKGKSYQLFNIGMKMSGSLLSTGRGGDTQFMFTDGWRLDFPKFSVPVIICDASQYFN